MPKRQRDGDDLGPVQVLSRRPDSIARSRSVSMESASSEFSFYGSQTEAIAAQADREHKANLRHSALSDLPLPKHSDEPESPAHDGDPDASMEEFDASLDKSAVLRNAPQQPPNASSLGGLASPPKTPAPASQGHSSPAASTTPDADDGFVPQTPQGDPPSPSVRSRSPSLPPQLLSQLSKAQASPLGQAEPDIPLAVNDTINSLVQKHGWGPDLIEALTFLSLSPEHIYKFTDFEAIPYIAANIVNTIFIITNIGGENFPLLQSERGEVLRQDIIAAQSLLFDPPVEMLLNSVDMVVPQDTMAIIEKIYDVIAEFRALYLKNHEPSVWLPAVDKCPSYFVKSKQDMVIGPTQYVLRIVMIVFCHLQAGNVNLRDVFQPVPNVLE